MCLVTIATRANADDMGMEVTYGKERTLGIDPCCVRQVTNCEQADCNIKPIPILLGAAQIFFATNEEREASTRADGGRTSSGSPRVNEAGTEWKI